MTGLTSKQYAQKAIILIDEATANLEMALAVREKTHPIGCRALPSPETRYAVRMLYRLRKDLEWDWRDA